MGATSGEDLLEGALLAGFPKVEHEVGETFASSPLNFYKTLYENDPQELGVLDEKDFITNPYNKSNSNRNTLPGAKW